MGDCIFCKITKGEITTDFVYQSEKLVAFPDISPSADLHILIVPKEHIGNMTELDSSDGELLVEIYKVATKLAKDNNLEEDLYRVVVNGGKAQHVPHIHFHLLGGNWVKKI